MDDSFTLTLSGRSSTLETQYFPPIELSADKNYVAGLVEFTTFNSIPNIDVGNNKVYIEGCQILTIPTGSYEIEDIESYIRKAICQSNVTISIQPNNNELHSEIKCNRRIHFELEDSIGRLLGFTKRILEADVLHKSDLPVAILKVNTLQIQCNITVGIHKFQNICSSLKVPKLLFFQC